LSEEEISRLRRLPVMNKKKLGFLLKRLVAAGGTWTGGWVFGECYGPRTFVMKTSTVSPSKGNGSKEIQKCLFGLAV